jgi:hypothetical protein
MNRDREAKIELEEAVQLKDDEAEWWSALGALAWKMGEKDEALRALRKAVALEPKNAKRQYAFGQALREGGDIDGAVAAWRSAVALQPAYALYALSRALATTEPAESKELQSRLMNLQTQQRATDDAQTIGNVALNAAAAGDWAMAISQLKKAIDRCGECSVIWPAVSHAQLSSASINGSVHDGTGTIFVNALVTLRNLDTSVDTKAVSNGSGTYGIVSITPGRYTIEASAPSSSRQKVSAFTLTVGQSATLIFRCSWELRLPS